MYIAARTRDFPSGNTKPSEYETHLLCQLEKIHFCRFSPRRGDPAFLSRAAQGSLSLITGEPRRTLANKQPGKRCIQDCKNESKVYKRASFSASAFFRIIKRWKITCGEESIYRRGCWLCSWLWRENIFLRALLMWGCMRTWTGFICMLWLYIPPLSTSNPSINNNTFQQSKYTP